MDSTTWLGIAAAILVLLALAAVALRVHRRRVTRGFEVEAVQRQELAADREAESDAILQEAANDRRRAAEAAERARELQAEARALSTEAGEVGEEFVAFLLDALRQRFTRRRRRVDLRAPVRPLERGLDPRESASRRG